MKPASFCIVVLVIGLAFLVQACNYARMYDDEAVNTYQGAVQKEPAGTVPVAGGSLWLKQASPDDLHSPLPPSQETINAGERAYGYYCIQCHGPEANGDGTVGQSFAPLPADLRSPAVQKQGDGVLFYRIGLGYKRHPPLAYTVTAEDRWAVIAYMRSLAEK
jgi:mono/diheme cytochrome c family protein